MYYLYLNKGKIGDVTIDYIKDCFMIYAMYIPMVEDRGHGTEFVNRLINDLAKPKGCKHIVMAWVERYLINPLERRGFKIINETEYKKYSFLKQYKHNPDGGEEINLIKEIE